MSFRRAATATTAATVLIGCTLPLAGQAGARVVVPLGPGTGTAANATSLCAPPDDTVGPVVTQVTFGKPSIDLNT